MRISDWSSDVCSSDLALERIKRFAQRLVRRQLAHADAFRLVRWYAKRHPLLFKAQHIEFKLHAGDFLALQLHYATNAVFWVNYIIYDIERQRLERKSVV